MLFCSEAFLVFFVAIFTIYWLMPWDRARVWLLLVASFYFYASWNHWLALLIGLSTVFDYLLARGMSRWSDPRVRKSILTVSVVANLGLLCYFKYANFFLQSLQDSMRAFGATTSIPLLEVILPVGISFYTFEAINYMVDVYRRKVPAETSLPNFMLFITFFPHLVAGPIVRARDFLPQIRKPKHWDWMRMQLGLEYFLLGLFKKMAIADRMVAFVDPVFANPANYPTHTIWFAVVAYAFQIYCDFSGYTDMAIGCAHMLGYKLAPNFNMPYLAANISDFWRRWHISLSTWLRDYLFIPLGGSRGKRWRTSLNLLITMTLGGLWHGANWNFVLWGVVHGALLIGHRLFRDLAQAWHGLDRLLHTIVGRGFSVILTFLTVCLTWILFRATSLENIGTIFYRMFHAVKGEYTPAPVAGLLYTGLLMALCHWLAHELWFKRTTTRTPAPVLGVVYALMLMVSLLMEPRSAQAFIYFQF